MTGSIYIVVKLRRRGNLKNYYIDLYVPIDDLAAAVGFDCYGVQDSEKSAIRCLDANFRSV